MFRRNFDLIAVFVVLAGMASIQGAPRMGRRVNVAAVRYQTTVVAKQCALAERVLSRVRVRRSE